MRDPTQPEDLQLEHLRTCQMCRMIKASPDLHPSAGWDSSLCFDISIELLIDGFNNRNNEFPLFNSTPYINKRYEMDRLGGAFFAPGKSSHSTVRQPGTTNVSFRPSAGEQTSKFFLLFKTISTCEAGKGLIYVQFHKFYSDAALILDQLKMFHNNPVALKHFENAAQALRIYCRKSPNNLIAKDKLTVCGTNLYTSIYNSSKIEMCKKCSNCSVTADVMRFAENYIQFILSVGPKTNLKLIRVTDRANIDHFVRNYCTQLGDKLTLNSNENIIFKLSNLF